MAPDSKPESDDRQRLPFEPASSRRKGKAPATSTDRASRGRNTSSAKSLKTTTDTDAPPSAASAKRTGNSQERSQSNPLQERARRILGKSSPVQETLPQPSKDSGIPEVVSRRMVSRMVVLCGIPSTLGILVFIIAYQLVSKGWVLLPNVAVLLASMGCFGLGVIGLSYGALSASWEEDTPGSFLGASEFAVNVKRMTDAWAEARERKRAAKQL